MTTTDQTERTGCEPSLGGGARPRLTGLEPGLSVKASLPGLLAGLRQGDQPAAAAALRRAGRAAIPGLLGVLRDDEANDPARHAAARTLGEIGDASAAPGLLEAVRGADHDLRRGILDTLCGLGGAALPHLLVALADADPRLRWVATRSLEQLGDVAALPNLVAVLGDEDYLVRLAAIRALERLGTPEALAAIQGARAAPSAKPLEPHP